MTAFMEMPKYRCHKEVHALKIKELRRGAYNDATDEAVFIITPEEEGYLPFKVAESFINKHNPQPGGYYVVDSDGYASFSPKKAFEDGYKRI